MVVPIEVKRERVFSRIDEIIDRKLCDVGTKTLSLTTYINAYDSALRRACLRHFGSLENALKEYGYVDDYYYISKKEIINYLYEIHHISEDYLMKFDHELFLNLISLLKDANYDDVDIRRILRQAISELLDESLSKLVFEVDPDDLWKYWKDGKKENRKLNNRIVKKYGSIAEFYRAFNINKKLLSGYSFKGRKILMEMGLEFERLMKSVFEEIGISYTYQSRVGKCIPDFILEDCWVDAKLSKSTALNNGVNTIEKYRRHTDALTIIYAIDDESNVSSYEHLANFVCVTEYYPFLSAETQRKIDDFISKVKRIKNAGKGDYEE